MKTTHTGLGITDADWDAAANHQAGTLAQLHVPEHEQREVLGLVSSLKPDIVEK
jgi:hemoglobin